VTSEGASDLMKENKKTIPTNNGKIRAASTLNLVREPCTLTTSAIDVLSLVTTLEIVLKILPTLNEITTLPNILTNLLMTFKL